MNDGQNVSTTGIVVIGRNEGDRLRRCLESIRHVTTSVVYVDSGSRDDSVELSRRLGALVVELDSDIPFTAARVRNAGFERLIQCHPTLEYVFFVDGDCEVSDGWLAKAEAFLRDHPQVAVVWGMRRERFPRRSIYNMLCDIEWNSYPVGETRGCGGDAMMRASIFRQLNGYRPDLICGEEPELCVRFRQAGWRVWHLDTEMTVHDAALYHFSQWWKRMLRGGYAFAQGVALHGAPPERHWVRESRRIWMWGAFIPICAIVFTVAFKEWGLLVLLLYPLQVMRLALRGKRSTRENWWYAGAIVLAKFPEVLGQIKYFVNRVRSEQPRLIEYK
jgi:glycosyltransferase involved in cell wall biosynthesis